MAHDAGHLVFWKPRAADVGDSSAIWHSLNDGLPAEALEEIDVDAILSALKRCYRSFKPPQPVELDFPKEQTATTITWSVRHFSFFFEGDAFKQMDRVSLLMSKLGFGCFDVLANQCYTPDEPPRFVGSPDSEAWWRICKKVQMERSNALIAELGYPVDPRTNRSATLRDLFRTDPARARAINDEYLRRLTAVTTGAEVRAEVNRRMALRAARQLKKRSKG